MNERFYGAVAQMVGGRLAGKIRPVIIDRELERVLVVGSGLDDDEITDCEVRDQHLAAVRANAAAYVNPIFDWYTMADISLLPVYKGQGKHSLMVEEA